jgi:hypothetical protein
MKGEHEQVLAEYLNCGKTPLQIKTLIMNTRQRILKGDTYMRVEGVAEILRLANDPDTNEVDKQRLMDLSGKTMRDMHFAISQKKNRYLTNPETNDKLREIKIVREPFSQFVLPAEMWKTVTNEHRQRVSDRNHYQKKNGEQVQISMEEADAMVKKATDYITSGADWTKRANGNRLLGALCLLTGRRRWELYHTLHMRCVPDNDYQAEVRGICKVHAHKAMQWIRIPLLAPYPLIVQGICQARKITGRTMDQLTSGNLFGKSMNHTTYRNLYTELAWRDRETKNKFRIGDEACSPLYWKSYALGVSVSDAVNHYSIMSVNQDYEPGNDDHGDQEHKE